MVKLDLKDLLSSLNLLMFEAENLLDMVFSRLIILALSPHSLRLKSLPAPTSFSCCLESQGSCCCCSISSRGTEKGANWWQEYGNGSEKNSVGILSGAECFGSLHVRISELSFSLPVNKSSKLLFFFRVIKEVQWNMRKWNKKGKKTSLARLKLETHSAESCTTAVNLPFAWSFRC